MWKTYHNQELQVESQGEVVHNNVTQILDKLDKIDCSQQKQCPILSKLNKYTPMAAGAKLQKSFQDYFRIPVLLKAIGSTSKQALNHIAAIFNQIDRFSITQNEFSLSSKEFPVNKQKIKKNPQLYERIFTDMNQRGYDQNYKLLFLSDDFDNDWSELQIIYRVTFVILVYTGEELQNASYDSIANRKGSGGTVNTDLNEKINKINMRLKQKNQEILGIIFLNDSEELSKTLIPGLKFTIIPPSLPLEQLSMFIEPWLIDLIPKIQQNIVEHILQCRYQENTIIVFNRSEDKSEPKIMKKKKKFRCLKISGDLALMLHLYQLAYESYQQADEQLKKVDDWMWVLGCIQGKIACMTSSGDLNVRESSIEKEIEQLITESFIYSKKIKYQCFEIENLFKILKLLLHQDKQKFDDLIESTLASSKGLTEQQKFLYYSYIGSLYTKASMERKRNYYYYKASLIIENFKPQISQLLLKTIKQSKYIGDWEELNSKVIQRIIENEQYFSPDGTMHLELIEKCSGVLNEREILNIKDYLNYGNFQEKLIQGPGDQLIQVKQFSILESPIKPKPNRLIVDESPKKINTSGVFVGWKKKLTYLYEHGELIVLNGTILNKLPFEIRLKVSIQISDNSQKIPEFSLILPPSYPFKFNKSISFSFSQQPLTIKRVKFSIWNFILYKSIQPQISFQLYEKQPIFQLEVQEGQKVLDQREKISIQIQESSQISVKCLLKKLNSIESDRLRVSCSVYYDIDVGFQENQYIFSVQNKFNGVDLSPDNNIPNIKFTQSNQKDSKIDFDKVDNLLILKLKKFKTTREHIKKLQINLDYIKQPNSKYQLNKQYIVQPKIVNSVWAQIIQVSTPGLQTAVLGMKNHSQAQIQQFKLNWNVIQDSFLARIRFSKNQFNLRPFKVWPIENKQNNAVIIGKNQVILSNLTQGEMLVKLPKVKIHTKSKSFIVSQQFMQGSDIQQNNVIEPLTFRWQNIVNKNMQGVINLQIKPTNLMICPNLQFSVKIDKENNNEQKILIKCQTYKLVYTILSSSGQQIKPHKVSIKPYSDIHTYSQTNQNTQTNPNDQNGNESLGNSNINILVMGKTKINRVNTKSYPNYSHQNQNQIEKIVENRQFKNQLTIRIVKEKLNEKNDKEKPESQVSIVVTIEFDQKDIGKWQQIVKLA